MRIIYKTQLTRHSGGEDASLPHIPPRWRHWSAVAAENAASTQNIPNSSAFVMAKYLWRNQEAIRVAKMEKLFANPHKNHRCRYVLAPDTFCKPWNPHSHQQRWCDHAFTSFGANRIIISSHGEPYGCKYIVTAHKYLHAEEPETETNPWAFDLMTLHLHRFATARSKS